MPLYKCILQQNGSCWMVIQVDTIPLSPAETTIVFGGVGTGAFLFAIPLAYALHRFGARMVFGVVLLLSSMATALLPLAARHGILWMLTARVIQG